MTNQDIQPATERGGTLADPEPEVVISDRLTALARKVAVQSLLLVTFTNYIVDSHSLSHDITQPVQELPFALMIQKFSIVC